MATSSILVILLAVLSCLSSGADLNLKLRNSEGPTGTSDDDYFDDWVKSTIQKADKEDHQTDIGPVVATGHRHYRFAKRDVSWRADILAGVTTYDSSNAQPGTMLVYGDNAEVISVNSNIDTYMAAAEFDDGRVMVFPHETLTKTILVKQPTVNQQFLKNLKLWLTKGSYTSDDEICDITGLGELDDIPSQCKVLVWVGKDAETGAFYTNLENWVKGGGALVTGHAGWKYVADNPNSPVGEMPSAKIMNELGIVFLEKKLGKGKYNIYGTHEQNCEKAHMGKLCESCRTEEINLAICNSWLKWVFKLSISPTALTNLVQIYTNMLEDRAKSINLIPSRSNPVTGIIGRNCTEMINLILVNTGQYNGQVKAPGIKDFPGDLDETPELKSATFTATCNSSSLSKAFPTGYFVPAGTELIVTWSSPPKGTWWIKVGSSQDLLYGAARDTYKRWPQLRFQEIIKQSPHKIRTPFGGNIYLWAPTQMVDTISVTFEHVIDAPFFTYDQSSKWESEIRNRKGLWADIEGDNLILTLPAGLIRNLPDPTETMKQWDKVVATEYELLTYDSSDGRGQWGVADIQVTGTGQFHSGYPIGVWYRVVLPGNVDAWSPNIFDLPYLKKKGAWWMYHEFGHNMQEGAWTFTGCSEVTSDIFILYAMDKLNGIGPWPDWLLKHCNNFLTQESAEFSKYRALCSYAQLARDFGWDPYKRIFREYYEIPDGQKPTANQDKIDQWIIRFSKQIKRNLAPFYEFWKFDISSKVLEAVQEFPGFLPSDETTNEYAVESAQSIMTKYGVTKLGV